MLASCLDRLLDELSPTTDFGSTVVATEAWIDPSLIVDVGGRAD